mmetsp:Transcript_54124/g.162023  ORF Transcript_54124/g.162023 Transcript_54124/m.162023 type:complete len:206 (-) Transcript_54124:496-1113(-)
MIDVDGRDAVGVLAVPEGAVTARVAAVAVEEVRTEVVGVLGVVRVALLHHVEELMGARRDVGGVLELMIAAVAVHIPDGPDVLADFGPARGGQNDAVRIPVRAAAIAARERRRRAAAPAPGAPLVLLAQRRPSPLPPPVGRDVNQPKLEDRTELLHGRLEVGRRDYALVSSLGRQPDAGPRLGRHGPAEGCALLGRRQEVLREGG